VLREALLLVRLLVVVQDAIWVLLWALQAVHMSEIWWGKSSDIPR
jgi:hypothetical protein